jgi:hypothetical protein
MRRAAIRSPSRLAFEDTRSPSAACCWSEGGSATSSAALAQLGVGSTYAAHILPGLIATALGLGLIMAATMNTGTRGVSAPDAGVASAMVNTMQQIGVSLGTALLSTLAASATTGYVAGTQPSAAVVSQAAAHGYTVAFW